MRVIRAKRFNGSSAWQALDIADMNNITTRLHWTDKAYHWHVNEGEEVFVVLDGEVIMHFEQDGVRRSTVLRTSDIFYASSGTQHCAEPKGQARILVIEHKGSV